MDAVSDLAGLRSRITAWALGCAVALLGGLLVAAPAANAGSKPPLRGELNVPGPLVGSVQQEYLPFEFTSLAPCREKCRRKGGAKGFARIEMPPPQLKEAGNAWTVLGTAGDIPDSNEIPHTESSSESGYVDVDRGSCTKVAIDSVKGASIFPFPDPAARSFADVRFLCKRGESFVVNYILNIDYYGFDQFSTPDEEWEFGLRHRTAEKPWRSLPNRPMISVKPQALDVPVPSFDIAPPAKLVETVVEEPPGEDPIIYFTLNGLNEEGVKIERTLQVGGLPGAPSGFFKIDQNGDPVPLAVNLDNIDDLRSTDQLSIELVNCLVGVCRYPGNDFQEVRLYIPPTAMVGGAGSNAWANIFASNLSYQGWARNARDCLSVGGTFEDSTVLPPPGDGETLQDWRCEFAGADNADLGAITRDVFNVQGTQYNLVCPSRLFHRFDWNPAGDDYIWCPLITGPGAG